MSNGLFQKLYLQVSLQKFSYCIKNQSDNKIIHFKSFDLDAFKTIEQQLDFFFDKEEPLQSGFDDILVLHDNNLNTFVADALFDETALGSYLQYNVKVFPTDYFDYDAIDSLQMKNVYVPYVVFNNYFLDRFGSFDFQHINTGLVQHFIDKSLNDGAKDFFVHIAGNHFEIVIVENKKLVFFNSFEYQTKEDFIYYILFVMEQLQLNPQEQSIQLSGKIDSSSELYNIVYQFVINVKIIETATAAQSISIEEKQLQEHCILVQL